MNQYEKIEDLEKNLKSAQEHVSLLQKYLEGTNSAYFKLEEKNNRLGKFLDAKTRLLKLSNDVNILLIKELEDSVADNN